MRNFLFILALLGICFCIQCTNSNHSVQIRVKNTCNFPIKSALASIATSQIEQHTGNIDYRLVWIKSDASDSLEITQLVDTNSDGKIDELLFAVDFEAEQEKTFTLGYHTNHSYKQKKNNETTYGRFVPERIDDFAWENNRVAFRIYGPRAQQLADSGLPNGTLSSGIDCWLKKVNYPIIDKWYKLNVDSAGYYHTDHGEGYDPYHVGKSLGCGGFGILYNDSLLTTKNFTTYRIISNGPLRTIFEVTYAPFQVAGSQVNLKKQISLDLGSNLTRITLLTDTQSIRNGVIGITLHNQQGSIQSDDQMNWLSYQEKMGQTDLFTGILLQQKYHSGYKVFKNNQPDNHHVFVMLKLFKSNVSYYTGFAWQGANQFNNQNEWNAYLERFAEQLDHPLEIALE